MVTFRKRLRFSGRVARAYLTVASQAALVLENLRLIEEARGAGRRGGILLERQRLAREIHDTLAQGFTGIITSLTLKLYGIPETILSAVCPFTSIEGACNATIVALQMGLSLARIELADEVQIRACNAYSHLNLPEVPTLFLEFHGTAQSTREQVEAFAEIGTQTSVESTSVPGLKPRAAQYAS